MPTVSIIIPSYNHAPYIGETIRSALDQTFQDIEIIICDDASTDNSRDVVEQFKDKRIQTLFFENNREFNMRNEGLKKARGEYIALLNSDDKFERTKLEKQVSFLKEHSEVVAVFTKVFFIDDNSEIIYDENGNPIEKWFTCGNCSRYEWLKRFFSRGNCLCHPSVLMRKEFLLKADSYNPNLFLLSDMDLWIRLCFLGEIHIMNEKLTYMRWLKDNKNLSAPRQDTMNVVTYEMSKILEHYNSPFVSDNFNKIFRDYNGNDLKSEKLLYLINKAYETRKFSHHLFASDLFYNLLMEQKSLEKLQSIDPSIRKQFFSMLGDIDFSRFIENRGSKKYQKSSKVGNEEKRVPEASRSKETGKGLSPPGGKYDKVASENKILKEKLTAVYNSITWKTGNIFIRPLAILHQGFLRIFRRQPPDA